MPDEAPAEIVLPVMEESLHLETRGAETGRVSVSLSTETQEEVLRKTLRSQRAEVERHTVGRTVSEVPKIRQEGNLLIIPVVEEVLVVEKRLVLREEIHLRLTDDVVEVEQPVTRRVQHAVVERLPPAAGEENS
ncbi:YsnF/AvaK domain-containing protein [Roseomonas xinghualingensis]|uniref:YsnF/AvaK domain-containing protein n=1 Tax=Roseomonas xinghualingensis TaxID=2986475 RepID=UPI0021F18E74|nr:YsnF/AvaK domain-containing protein [Roseomonas sp. SXEYE001]MCV4206729.1 YsnF/AvaK domain-containing protein [Roseomonas sp. SXEYE001]